MKLLAVVATVLITLVGTAAVASAHHADITATAGCANGTPQVSFTTTAFTPGTDKQRTNPKIEVAYSTTGQSGTFTQVTVGAFNPADQFTFSGTFTPNPATPGNTITVRAVALVHWADSAAPGEPHFAEAILPSDCAPPPVPVVTLTALCASGTATAHLVIDNPAAASQTFEVSINGGTAVSVVVAAKSSSTMDKVFNPASPPTYVVTDTALNFSATRTIPTGFTCQPPGTATATATATCDTTGPSPVETAHLVVSNNSGSTQTFAVAVNGTPLAPLVISAGGTGTVGRAFTPGSPPTFVVTDAALAFSATETVAEVSCVKGIVVTPPTTTPTTTSTVPVHVLGTQVSSAPSTDATLPTTGTDPRPLGELALTLILAGLVTVRLTTSLARTPAGKHFQRT